MECHLRRVNFMVGTVIYIRINANYRESAKDTCMCCLLDSFADCRDIFLWNRTADNRRFKLEEFFAVCIHRRKFDFAVAILSTSTRLLRILGIHIDFLCDRLFVGNLRCADICLNLELAQKSVYDNLKMELTHTCDNCLSCLWIGVRTECRVFLCKLCKCLTHLALTCLCLRLDRELDNRLREFHRLQNYRMLIITDRIAGRCKLKSNCGSDITGVNLV